MPFCSKCGNELIDDAKFCYKCGAPIVNNTVSQTTRRVVYQGEIRKCPNCGEPLRSFDLNCPACGFEIRGIQATSSVKEFAQKLEEIESMREYEKPRLFKTASSREYIPKADVQKISLIRSFSVPNTVEDMLEFMILASTNIDLSVYSKTDTTYDKARKAVADAWLSKVEQVYIKAKNSYSTNENFSRIQEIYDDCKIKINKKKKSKIIKWVLLVGWIPLLLIISIIVATTTYPETKSKEEQRLQSIVTEAEGYLSTNNYQQALRRAETIKYKLSDEDEEERWDIIREDLIDRIIAEAHDDGIELEYPSNLEPTSYINIFHK